MDRVTKPQKKMLITLLRETKYMEGKKEKEWYWEKIQAALNTIGPKKTIIQWKKCWRDMRLTTRKKLAELKRCQMAGGSPPPGVELSQEDNDIIDIVGTEYFYEEMNGELKSENFMSSFDYVPEHFCDAILTATTVSNGQQLINHQKDHQHSGQQLPDHQQNDSETNDTTVSTNNADNQSNSFQTPGVSAIQQHSSEHTAGSVSAHLSNPIVQHPVFHSGLQSQLLRRQQHAAATFHRESVFEEKLLQFMQDAFPKKSKRKKSRDPDKLFLLSLYEEIKRVPEEIRLDVKAELIQVLKKYQKKNHIKLEKLQSQVTSAAPAAPKQNIASLNDKTQLNQHAQLSHSMYQLQKKYDKHEKEHSPQSQIDRIQQHARDTSAPTPPGPQHQSQQIPHALFQLQKKYDDNVEKVHHQNEQRKHEAGHQQQQHSSHQQPPPNDQHLHHPHMPHSIMFPLPQIRTEQPGSQQHHPHNQQQHPHQQAIFAPSASQASMTTDRSTMAYENVA